MIETPDTCAGCRLFVDGKPCPAWPDWSPPAATDPACSEYEARL